MRPTLTTRCRQPKSSHLLRNLVGPLGLAVAFGLCGAMICAAAESPVQLDAAGYDPSCGIEIVQRGSLVHVSWPLDANRQAVLDFDLRGDRPLIHSIGMSKQPGTPAAPIATGLDPVILLRVGDRELDERRGWTVFFDRMQRKPSAVHLAEIQRSTATASSHARRATLTIGDVSAGPFRGQLRWTFYAGNPFILQEAVLSTEQDAVAYLYDMGLVCRQDVPRSMSWHDSLGPLEEESVDKIRTARHLAVRGRALGAQFEGGAIALFPPPHRYFYPLDFSDNLKNIWVGPNYGEEPLPFGFGIRHDPRGDNRFVPWFNAPPGTVQEMGLFLLLSGGTAGQALDEVAKLTRGDRFASLPGHRVFTSHFHVEHTQEMLQAQHSENRPVATTPKGKLPSGGRYVIPERLESPGFVRTLRDMGVDIVHLAEFHFGHTPRMTMDERIEHLELLHAECRRLSDEDFLLLPGEEPNVHLGGHWISFFPHPVYWVLNRPEGTPFVMEHPQLGRVYHVGSPTDVLRLLEAERGLAWTAHPRIKSSVGFPDGYRGREFFHSEHFLGGAWKAMPADLSQPRLGQRVLDLLDDMANWGHRKYILGEVDVFKIEPDHELYGHMNVNYLRLDRVPRFGDGWQPVLDALRGGSYFVTTGEVLIPEFTVDGRKSGETLSLTADGQAEVRLGLQWTFPLSYAEIISGDGRQVQRQRVDLSHSGSFGEDTFRWDTDLAGQHWVRVEVWDIATNGAFTQPVWLGQQ